MYLVYTPDFFFLSAGPLLLSFAKHWSDKGFRRWHRSSCPLVEGLRSSSVSGGNRSARTSMSWRRQTRKKSVSLVWLRNKRVWGKRDWEACVLMLRDIMPALYCGRELLVLLLSAFLRYCVRCVWCAPPGTEILAPSTWLTRLLFQQKGISFGGKGEGEGRLDTMGIMNSIIITLWK